MHRLLDAPVLGGAVQVSADHADGDFENGPRADLEYALARPLAAACPELLHLYLASGYTLAAYSTRPADSPIEDPDVWCATELVPDSDTSVAAIAVVHAPGADTRYPNDGFTAQLTPSGPDGAASQGTRLRLSVG